MIAALLSERYSCSDFYMDVTLSEEAWVGGVSYTKSGDLVSGSQYSTSSFCQQNGVSL
jgi:hypothetical protein